jgi:hypothetical protein
LSNNNNPYASPASISVPRLRVVPALPWGKEARFSLLPLIYLAGFFYYQVNRLRRNGGAFHLDSVGWTALSTLVLFLTAQVLIKVIDGSRIRRRSLVISRLQPLAGGRAALSGTHAERSDFLFLTPEALIMLSLRATSWDQEPYQIPLSEIARVEVPGWLGLNGLLGLYLHSGELIELTVGRPHLWKKLIEQARATALTA